MKKTIFTLDVDNYAPEIIKITRPYLEKYAEKIGADLYVINERKFPDMPAVYEKLQIYELGKEMKNDWNIFFDADALIHPETIDFTALLSKDTVACNRIDMALVRWKPDKYFLRDGRNIGWGNWNAFASDQCLDLWKPLDDLTLEEAVKNIYPTNAEKLSGIVPSHLIDDYTLSRNVARFGLKHKTLKDILKEQGLEDAEFFWHEYTINKEVKIAMLQEVIKRWKV